MRANKDRVNLYKTNFINYMEKVGWYLVEDCGYIKNRGDGLWWITCLVFENGVNKRTIHHMGTTRDTFNYFVGAYKALTYAVDF